MSLGREGRVLREEKQPGRRSFISLWPELLFSATSLFAGTEYFLFFHITVSFPMEFKTRHD